MSVLLQPDRASHPDDGGRASRPALVWRLPEDTIAIASAVLGGGVGPRDWIVNAQVGLDYRDATFSCHDVLQEFKTHPKIGKMLEGGERVQWGAKTIPEGGFYSMPRKLNAPGLLLCGDGAPRAS